MSVVPHTHWDREWYEPFAVFRTRLVALLDDLLTRLVHDPSFTHFLLDGQMAVVDDYLAVRPDAAALLERLARDGRLAMGPWYTLPDEFLVSAETLVRDLQLGLDRAARYGGAMAVGYLPDMFGHVAQMPQLFAQLGFEHAVVWRGTPAAVDRTGFWWEAPDGSRVRAEYLPQGYGNGAFLPDDPGLLLARVAEFVAAHPVVGAHDPVLWMHGGDHQSPAPHLPHVLAAANASSHDLSFEIVPLADHLASAPIDDLPVWRGELRSGARANLLMGVVSNRTDVRQEAVRATRLLEQVAEPLWATLGPPDAFPTAALDAAWLEVIRNAAHDSVCACSADEVVDAVLVRYREASATARALVAQLLDDLASQLAAPGPLVVNPVARDRRAVVEVELAGEHAPAGTQLVATTPALVEVLVAPAASVPVIVERELEIRPDVRDVTVTRDAVGGAVATVVLDGGHDPFRRVLAGPLLARVRDALAGLPADAPVRVLARQQPSVRALVPVEVAAFGWRRADPATAPDLGRVEVGAGTGAATVRVGNGLVEVVVDTATGLFSIDGVAGFGRLVDGGDEGDTYNWSPPEHDLVVDGPDACVVRVDETGPLRATVVVDAEWTLPERVDDHRRAGARRATVTTTVRLLAGEPFVRVAHTVDNVWRDHRLRAHLPLPHPAATSQAECAFAVVERGLVAEGGPTEAPLATFPSRRFVRAGGLTVVHDGLHEYELVDLALGDDGSPVTARTLALTLLRCTGMLSQGPMRMRPLPAGPLLALEGPQLQRRITVSYAVQVDGDRSVDPYAMAEAVLVELPTTFSLGGGTRADEGSALAIEGAEVSAVRRRAGGQLEVRVFNPTPDPVVVRVPGRRGQRVDLRGRAVEPFVTAFELGPWAIATVHLR